MTVEQLERLFNDFQRDDTVQTELHRALGMFIRLNNPRKEEDVFEMEEQLKTLLSCGERQGFKNGFKAAFLILSNKSNTSVVETIDYLEAVDVIEKS